MTLSGRVKSKDEEAKAIALARTVKGVTDVKSRCKYSRAQARLSGVRSPGRIRSRVPDLVLRVSSVRRATPASRIVRVDLDGAAFHYRAGQVAAIGPARSPIQIPYSIASAPEETEKDGRSNS